MACIAPLNGFYSKVIGASGKRGITFDRGASFSGVPLKLPCGRCIGCKLERSRQWAMRCLHEAKLHNSNFFTTLTYNDENLPFAHSLLKRDLQLFMKRLRKARGAGVRFYGCGEYGDRNKRPHYHVLLFNCEFPDIKRAGANRRGDPYYSSSELTKLWGLGHTMLGDVTFDSAAYVARYVMKKLSGEKVDQYDILDQSDGVIYRRVPEFTIMSRRPGIGTGWFEKYGSETYTHDSVIVNGRPVRPPRFYDGKRELLDPDGFAVLKSIRRHKATANFRENLIDRRQVKERIAYSHLSKLHREI